MNLEREVDEEYPFKTDDYDTPYLPDGLTKDGDLYVLPNGKYLPRGVYRMQNGGTLLYEPKRLDPFAELLRGCTEE